MLSDSRDLAKQCADWFKANKSRTLSVAEIGTVEGETFEGQVEASLDEGANCVFMVDQVGDDGPQFIAKPL